MKYCGNCGTNVEGMNFCPNCGNNVSDAPSPIVTAQTPKMSVKKSKKCDCCGAKLHSFASILIADGYICPSCGRFAINSPTATILQVRATVINNRHRFQIFNPTMTITNLACGYIFVDTEQQYCYVSPSKNVIEPIVFKYSEIEEYRIERVGEKTIIKTKGGIKRATIGGALFGGAGAVVGAATAKQEVHKTTGTAVLYIDLNISGLRTTVSIANPPFQAANFLDNAIDQAK